ncbi:helix-turn-helix domain-containing protein [Demequina sp. SO4-13]|uniref:helix-turn-helix domain-containing protein n=1 Tax=Demequina sp. SO4-13 TaxID=3401027 RepID=UPI003AF9390E
MKYEREKEGWTYQTLARKMDAAGCKVAISSLNRLEKDNPPRRVNVDEVLAFCEVFGLDFETMITAPSSSEPTHIVVALQHYSDRVERLTHERGEVLRSEKQLLDRARKSSRDSIEQAVRTWSTSLRIDESLVPRFIAFLTGDTQQSPWANAIGGTVERPPGTGNLLNQETGE